MFLDFVINNLNPAAFFQSMLLAIFLFTLNKGPKKPNRMLALFVLAMGIMIGGRYLYFLHGFIDYRLLVSFAFDCRFLMGPLFYLYLKSVFKPNSKLKPWDLLHSGVFVYVVVFQLNHDTFWFNPWKIFVIVDLVQISVYLLWAFIEFKLVYLFTNPARYKMDPRYTLWLQFFVMINFLTLLSLVLSWLFLNQVIFILNWDFWISRLTIFTNFVFINTIVFIALKIPDFFISIKYKNGDLPQAILQRYKTKLTGYMETNKPWMDPLLSLNSLADDLSISPKHLSQVINLVFQQNFYQYINAFRVEECKRKMADPSAGSDNLLEIAYAAGFNSKNTFNAAFKKSTGMTPSEYRKQYSL